MARRRRAAAPDGGAAEAAAGAPRARRGVRGAVRRAGGAPRRRLGAGPKPERRGGGRSARSRGARARPDAARRARCAVCRARRAARRGARRCRAARALRAGDGPVRLTVVLPEPTPYRTGMLDRLAERPDLDLTVALRRPRGPAAGVDVDLRHRAVLVEGKRVPGASRVLRHDYPLSLGDLPGLAGRATRTWSSCRAGARSPRRPRWPGAGAHECPTSCSSRATSATRGRAGGGPSRAPSSRRSSAPPRRCSSSARWRESRCSRAASIRSGCPSSRTRSTSGASAARRTRPRGRRDALRAEVGVAADDVAVLSVARLAPEKGLDTLVRAVSSAGDPRLVLLLAGSGPEQEHARVARSRARRPARAPARTSHGSGSSSDTPSPTCSRSSRATSRGASSSTRPRRAGCRSCCPTASALRSTCSRTAGTACSYRSDDAAAARGGTPRARGGPRAASRDGRGLARDRLRLGLRAEHREAAGGRAARRAAGVEPASASS